VILYNIQPVLDKKRLFVLLHNLTNVESTLNKDTNCPTPYVTLKFGMCENDLFSLRKEFLLPALARCLLPACLALLLISDPIPLLSLDFPCGPLSLPPSVLI
jgi:hypothetical protein